MSQSKTHNYFYKITNLINEKFYYGIHSTDDLEDGYMGGGDAIRAAIRKYGRKNFAKEIIADYPTRKEVSDHEKLIVTADLIKSTECYNMRTGGDNEFTPTEETKKKISLAQLGDKNHRFGKTHSEETKKKISASSFGKTHSEETKKQMSELNKGEKHPMFGRNHSEESKKKMGEHSLRKSCIILEIPYISASEAARQLNLSISTVFARLKSKTIRFCEWQYC